MGSSAQVIVGGMLLVVAFLFGKYINDQPIVPTNKSTTSIAAKELPLRLAADLSEPKTDLQVPSPSQPAVVNKPDNSERSLRDRILGERKQRQAASNAFKPGLGNGLFQPDEPVFAQKPKQLDSLSSLDKEIAVPDFSYLEASPLPEDLPALDRPLPRKPQIESFSQFKPIKPIDPIELPQLDFPKSPPSPTEFTADKLSVKMPFKNTNDVIVGPINSRANHSEFNTRPPAFPVSPRMSDSRRSGLDSRLSGGAFQTPRASRSLLQSPSPQRKLEKVSRRDTDSLVPVRHRESRLTTEVQEFFTYKTVFGDTLHGLSTRFFGKPDFYLDIYLANKDKFENPTKMPVNAQLQIPVMAKLINRK